MRYLLALLAFVLCPAAANAAWHEASSEHFVVYADQSEKQIREFSERLERYHSALELAVPFKAPPPSPSNRVFVFVVDNIREVEKLYGEGGDSIAGFYSARPGGSFAIVPRVKTSGRETDFSMIVLLHEYAHHYLISNVGFAMPRWMSEGAAQFFAAATFRNDGSLVLAQPSLHALRMLAYGRDVPVEELLIPSGKRLDQDGFYGKSWLLYHYLMRDTARDGQMRQYLQALLEGRGLERAARETFGDFDKLEKELGAYSRQRKMMALLVNADALRTGDIQIRAMRDGETEAMPWRIRSHRGVDEDQAKEVVAGLREVAARYPDDPAVLSALAEAEFDAGDDDAAIAAADRALARDPGQVNAYVQKGYALFRKADDADDPAQAYEEAVQPFLALNKIENDHPLPLIYYFRSQTAQGGEVPQIAKDALAQAVGLAPFDMGLRMNLAMQMLRDRDFAMARRHFLPIAYNPHGGDMAGRVQAVVERIDEDGEIDPLQVQMLLRGPAEVTLDTGAEEKEE